MKKHGREQRFQAASGRTPHQGEGGQLRHGFWWALLLTHGSYDLQSWDNISGDAWAEPGFRAKLLDLASQWLNTPAHRDQEYALITLSNADTFTEGLALMLPNRVEMGKFFVRHPRSTLKVVLQLGSPAALAEADAL